jgi:pimeloyl-ACP methyl ester carboxylesterase
MREFSCRFGDQDRLVGIITAPDTPDRRAALVLVTAGVSSKSGPFRLYAELARRVARDGFLTLRFDLGGVGDSRPEATGKPLLARTLCEIGAALDYLTEAHDIDTVVLCGLCSGAEDSFRAAETDPRVGGVVMIDPFAYKTSAWALWHLVRGSRRRLLRALGIYRPLVGTAKSTLVAYKYLEASESSRILCALVKRRAHIHFVYTGGSPLFNHPRQLQAMFPDVAFDQLVTLDHLPHVDHTQLLESDRRKLIEAIARRLVWAGASAPEVRDSGVRLRGPGDAASDVRVAAS